MRIFRSQNELLVHTFQQHREDKATQTSNSTVEVENLRPEAEQPHCFPELSLEPGDPDAYFF